MPIIGMAIAMGLVDDVVLMLMECKDGELSSSVINK